MGAITAVKAYANNEVAYISWDISGPIPDCLGFELIRVYLNKDGSVQKLPNGKEDRVPLAAWVGFKGQRNPHWLPQTTSIWPVQKLSWRDLTLRKRRNKAKRRPDEVHVRYEVRPLGDLKPGLPPAPDPTPGSVKIVKCDGSGKPILDVNGRKVHETVAAYEGSPRPLAYLGDAVASDPLLVTRRHGKFQSTFTNGILAAQWLRNVIWDDGVKERDELIKMISAPDDPIRKYLAGDVLPLLHEVFARPGRFLMALYELEDRELIDLILANKSRIRIILANSALDRSGWDGRNTPARRELVDAGVDIQHRMFNNSTDIGHNKFVVHLPPGQGSRSVFTGSTNWTPTGVAGQSNNALLIEDDGVAGAYVDYWERMSDDKIALPDPLSDPMKDNQQGTKFRAANGAAQTFDLGGGTRLTTWFSPNMPKRNKSATVPPDLKDVYALMQGAQDAILFLAFYPGQSGKDCIVGKAIEFGLANPKLIVTGAVSSSQAMPNYVPAKKNDRNDPSDDEDAISPYTFQKGETSIVRAARVDERSLLADFGVEDLTAKKVGAIIHDKVVVIDPLSKDCAVVLGSHNLGFKASYANDENMVIVRGDRALAEAYAVHVLDVYDHYKFRAVEAELRRENKPGWSGFLSESDSWLKGYVDGSKGGLMRYFAQGR